MDTGGQCTVCRLHSPHYMYNSQITIPAETSLCVYVVFKIWVEGISTLCQSEPAAPDNQGPRKYYQL